MIIGELVIAVNLLYLAYLMHYILKHICLLCLITDTIHALLVVLHIYQYSYSHKTLKKKTA